MRVDVITGVGWLLCSAVEGRCATGRFWPGEVGGVCCVVGVYGDVVIFSSSSFRGDEYCVKCAWLQQRLFRMAGTRLHPERMRCQGRWMCMAFGFDVARVVCSKQVRGRLSGDRLTVFGFRIERK
jgi:hypothetical protein